MKYQPWKNKLNLNFNKLSEMETSKEEQHNNI